MPSKELLASISLVLYAIGYIPYFRDIFAGKTKPHMISWGIWAVLFGAVFGIQFQEGAGIGASLSGLITLGCFSVFCCSIWYGYRDIRTIDIVCGIVCLIAFPIWIFLNNPLVAMILFVGIDAVAGIPTLRKTWHHPNTETVHTYAFTVLSTILILFTFSDFSFVNCISPIYNFFYNGIISVLILFHGPKK